MSPKSILGKSLYLVFGRVYLVFDILNQGEKKRNGRVARFGVSLRSVFGVLDCVFEIWDILFGIWNTVFGTQDSVFGT